MNWLTAECWRGTLRPCAPSRRSPIPPWTATRCARSTQRRRPRPSRWSANPPPAALSKARSGRAKRCASSPGRRCPTAPTPSPFRRTLSARAIASGFRPPRDQATICVRPAWTFAKANPSSRPAAGSPPAMWRWRPQRTTPRLRCAAAPKWRSWRPATNWSSPVAPWARRRSSPPIISPSPGSSRRAGASRSISASRSMRSAR